MNDYRPAEDVATLKLQLELEKLERHWLEERQSYFVPRGIIELTVAKVIGGGIVCIVVGIFLISIGLWSFSHPDLDPEGSFKVIVVGVCLVGVGVVLGWRYFHRAQEYAEARQVYQHRREQLLQDIAASRERATAEEDNDQLAE